MIFPSGYPSVISQNSLHFVKLIFEILEILLDFSACFCSVLVAVLALLSSPYTSTMAHRPPKPYKLDEDVNFASFSSWRSNMEYNLQQDPNFAQFLVPDFRWAKSDVRDRGLLAVGSGPARVSGAQRVVHLNQMLGLIAQYVPCFLNHVIINNSTSISDVWNCIRKYYGLQQSESNFMKFSSITWEEGERPERLYQRVLAHLQDNLLTKGGTLKHDGVVPESDEFLSPTVERLAVLRWMELLHPRLTQLVARTFAYDLQRMTLKDIQPQIVDALDGFLAELKADEVSAARINFSKPKSKTYGKFQTATKPKSQYRFQQSHQQGPTCRLCKAEGRPSSHR